MPTSLTRRQSQRRRLSRLLLTQEPRQPPSWLILNVSQRSMNPPPRLFGFPARWRAGVVPVAFAAVDVADFRVRALRWELRDVSVDGLKLGSDGHIVSFAVEADQGERALFQQDSVFYHEEASSRLTCLEERLAQGDGVSTPRWHKVDRQWPVEDGRHLSLLGRVTSIRRLCIFSAIRPLCVSRCSAMMSRARTPRSITPMKKKGANKAPEPTPTSVTSPACAGAAPAAVVAHLER
jgi:hypothetical protein